MEYDNPWSLDDKPFTSEDIKDYVGFVYEIQNLNSGRKYIGKKNFYVSKTKQVKKKKKRFKVESNWKEYYGSNAELQNDVETLGPSSFKRTILRLCKKKGEMSYYEAKIQFERDVLLSTDYYNTWISCRVRSSHMS